MSSSFKDELLLMITEQDSPVIRTDWLTLKLNVKKEKVAKALLELKQEGDIFFIIKPTVIYLIFFRAGRMMVFTKLLEIF